MNKKLLYLGGAVVGIAIAYGKGFKHGMNAQDYIEDVDIDDKEIEDVEETLNEHVERVSEGVTEEEQNNEETSEDEEEFECSECEETFDTEHGKNIHKGQKH